MYWKSMFTEQASIGIAQRIFYISHVEKSERGAWRSLRILNFIRKHISLTPNIVIGHYKHTGNILISTNIRRNKRVEIAQ